MLLACCPCAFALNPALDVSQYAHTPWKIRDGFSKGTIFSIAQTPDGYLWLGTDFGLSRFDGFRNVPWQPPPDEPLPSSRIASVLAARDGTLWIGTSKGLASWKGGKLTQYAELAGLLVMALVEDREGSVWAGGMAFPSGRLCAIQKGRVQCYGEDGALGVGVLGLYEDSKGNLWAGGQNAVWRWKPGPPRLYPLPGETAGIAGLAEGHDGALLIGTRSGIRRFVDGKTELAYPLPGSVRFPVRSLLRDREGGLWFGTPGGGLVHAHQGRTDVFVQSDGLSGDVIQALFEDREGNVWVATTDGLDRFRDFAVPTFSANQGLSNIAARAVLAAKDGSVWLSTLDGLARWNHGQTTVYRGSSNGLPRAAQQGVARGIAGSGLPNRGESLFQDDRGRIWVSTVGGVGYMENDRYIPIGGVPGGEVYSIAEDARGDPWIANQDRGLLHLLGGTEVQAIPWAKLGRKDYALALAADRLHGGLWLGFSGGGIAYFADGQVRASYVAADGLGAGAVKDLRLDGDGTLWAATEGGLSRMKNGRVATLTSKNGLPCDGVHWVMEDDAHSFWLYMQCGLVRIARPELDAWAADSSHIIKAAVFDSADGVRSFATAGAYTPHAGKSPDGKLWFTGDGVSVVDPRHLPFNKLPPPVHIETVKINGKDVAAAEGMELSHRNNDLEIDYTALSLTIPERVRFRYKLEGKDQDWQDVGTRRQAYYNSLGPKNYRFRVMAANNDGVWNEAGAAWNFSITPAYYQTIWFEGLCVLAAAGFLWLLYRLRLRQVAQHYNLRMEERVNERTRIARDLHDTLLQSFQGVLLKFHAVTYRLPDRPEALKELESAIEQARQAIDEGRDAVQGLRSSVVVTNDLARAITTFGEGLASDQNGRRAPDFRVLVEGASRDLAPLVRDEVYRIAGEALRNAFRHAGARRVEVEIHYDTRRLRMRVRDDGKGIDPRVLGAGARSGHHGLPGMRERAELVGGNLAVWSELDAGTEIELTIPSAIAYAKAQAIKVGGQGNLMKG
jgi:signal transduction histidine kinase/ligand-binding sensor domain-containing protein